jgi:hypothetical protein
VSRRAKAAPRIGRPPLPEGEGRRQVLIVRVSAEEKESIGDAATKAGATTSEWIRGTLLDAANRPGTP